jgi:hypothetical protein
MLRDNAIFATLAETSNCCHAATSYISYLANYFDAFVTLASKKLYPKVVVSKCPRAPSAVKIFITRVVDKLINIDSCQCMMTSNLSTCHARFIGHSCCLTELAACVHHAQEITNLILGLYTCMSQLHLWHHKDCLPSRRVF